MASSDDNLIAERYARALFDLAAQQKQHESVKKDVSVLKSVLAESEALRKFLVSPAVSRKKADEAVNVLLAATKAGELTQRFMLVLSEERRLGIALAAFERYLALLAESRDELTAQVTSAQKLSKEELATITDALAKATGKKVEVKVAENPALIGGVRVQIGSRMLDNTVAGKLDRLQIALTRAA